MARGDKNYDQVVRKHNKGKTKSKARIAAVHQMVEAMIQGNQAQAGVAFKTYMQIASRDILLGEGDDEKEMTDDDNDESVDDTSMADDDDSDDGEDDSDDDSGEDDDGDYDDSDDDDGDDSDDDDGDYDDSDDSGDDDDSDEVNSSNTPPNRRNQMDEGKKGVNPFADKGKKGKKDEDCKCTKCKCDPCECGDKKSKAKGKK